MYLRLSHGTIDQAHGRNALPFSPASTSIVLEQTRQFANAIRGRDRLCILERAYDLEPQCAQMRLPQRRDVEWSFNLLARWRVGSGCYARLGSSRCGTPGGHRRSRRRRRSRPIVPPDTLHALQHLPVRSRLPIGCARRAIRRSTCRSAASLSKAGAPAPAGARGPRAARTPARAGVHAWCKASPTVPSEEAPRGQAASSRPVDILEVEPCLF